MSGVRVSSLPTGVTAKQIKIYFTKSEHGGGTVKEIYYPLFHDDAVVLFEDTFTADTILTHQHHVINKQAIYVEAIPQLQVFPILDAQIDPSVAAYIQTTDKVKDEIMYHGNLQYHHDDETNTSRIRGNWYQLEWAWRYIDKLMNEQTRLHTYVAIANTSRQSQTTSRSEPEAFAKSLQLPKGKTPIKGDTPIISMPNEELPVKNERTKDAKGKKSEDKVDSRNKGADSNDDTDNDLETTDKEKSLKQNITDKKVTMIRTGYADKSDTYNAEGKVHIVRFADSQDVKAEKILSTVILNDNPEDLTCLDFQYSGVRVSVYNGFITMEETEAIVNAAMGSMINGGGVAYAIASNASPDLQRQCDDYVQKHGPLPTSGVTHTCAVGKISEKVKYVIHAVGPIWSTYIKKETIAHQLMMAFYNSMVYGNDILKIKSIAMPVISSGIFGCPLEVCIQSFLDAVLLFTTRGEDLHTKEVHLVNNNGDNTALTVMMLRQHIAEGLDALTDKATKQFEEMSTKDDGGYSRTSVENRDKTTHRADETKSAHPGVTTIIGGQGSKQTKETVKNNSKHEVKDQNDRSRAQDDNAKGQGATSSADGKPEGRPLPPIPDDKKDKKKKNEKK